MPTAAVLTLAFVLAGCGPGSGEDAASKVAVRLLDALQRRDGATACAVLAPDTATQLEQSTGATCPEAILGEGLPAAGAVRQVDVYGQWARVVLTEDAVFLATFPDGWRVVAAGCRPQGERPYDCLLRGR